eukprot:4959128-Prymnesium_polylepis.1
MSDCHASTKRRALEGKRKKLRRNGGGGAIRVLHPAVPPHVARPPARPVLRPFFCGLADAEWRRR